MDNNNKTVVVTGGAGYIGTHVVIKLYQAGYSPVIIDNFCNSSPTVIEKLELLIGQRIEVANLDLRDADALASLFARARPQAIIHCAGLKAVGESVDHPVMYYEQNIGSTLTLLNQMDKVGCEQIVFSSSATVYGETGEVPSLEDARTCPANPYGRTKLFIEEIIRDWSAIGGSRSAALLRYFNPIGAHESGIIGEDPKGIPNNLIPLMLEWLLASVTHIRVW